MTETRNEEMRKRSGNVRCNSNLVSFLYELMRDHLPPGKVEEVLANSLWGAEITYTNGWLALYAEDVAKRLEGSCPETPK